MAGRDAFGTEFRRGDGATPVETFTAIAHVPSISGPSRAREAVETTAHDSADQYREFFFGLKDGGEVTLEINYDPTDLGHEALDDDFEDPNPRNYQIVILPGTAEEYTWDISAGITALGDEFPHDDKMARSVTLKITGKPTLTHTAGS